MYCTQCHSSQGRQAGCQRNGYKTNVLDQILGKAKVTNHVTFVAILSRASSQDAAIKAALQVHRTLKGKKKGVPGQDYPTFDTVPKTDFSCQGKVDDGFYGDPEADCQVFHRCVKEGKDVGQLTKYSFLCNNQTVFHQQYLVCDWWNKVDCSTTKDNYTLNERLPRRVGTSVKEEEVYPKGCPDYDYIYVFPNLFKPVKGTRVEGQVIDNVYSWQECGEYF